MRPIAAVIAGCLATSAAQAGVFVQMVKIDTKTHEESVGESYSVQNGQVRSEDKGEDAHTYSIFKDETLYRIDSRSKTYRVFDKKAAAALATKVSDAMEKMKARTASMPPEQRAAMETMIAKQRGGGRAEKVTYDAVATGETMTVNGKSCRVWNQTENGKLDEQLCVASFADLPGSDEFVSVMKSMSKLFEGMQQKSGQGRAMIDSKLAVLHKIDGFPISSRNFENGKLANKSTVVKLWQKQTIPAAQFDIPAGYKQQDMLGTSTTHGGADTESD